MASLSLVMTGRSIALFADGPLERLPSGGNLFVWSCADARATTSSAVAERSPNFETSGRSFTCDGSTLANCLSIHLSQKYLICSEFGIHHAPMRKFAVPRYFSEIDSLCDFSAEGIDPDQSDMGGRRRPEE